MLWMFQRVMFGEITKEENRKVKDLGGREVLILCSVVFFIVLMGVYPKMFFKKMDTSVAGLPELREAEERLLPDHGRENREPGPRRRAQCRGSTGRQSRRGLNDEYCAVASDFEWIIPEIVVTVFGLLVLLVDAFRREKAPAGPRACSPS